MYSNNPVNEREEKFTFTVECLISMDSTLSPREYQQELDSLKSEVRKEISKIDFVDNVS